MKKLILESSFLLFAVYSCAQNLVPNPSFEDTISCPQSVGQVFKCANWATYGHSPDYFNSCNTGSVASVPSNALGYQMAATGNAYCGLYHHGPTLNAREYIGSLLIQSLTIGQFYFVSMKVALANNSGFYCPSNNIGIQFSTIAYDTLNLPPLNNSAKIYSSSIVSDSVGWTLIKGGFVADSNYSHIIIGNFFTDSATQYGCNTNFFSSYYYIDDICVSTDSSLCFFVGSGEGIGQVEERLILSLISNKDELILMNKTHILMNAKISISDLLGKTLFSKQFQIEDSEIVPINFLNSSIYLITIQTTNTIQTTKFFKQ